MNRPPVRSFLHATTLLLALGALATPTPAVQLVVNVNNVADDTQELKDKIALLGPGPATLQFAAGTYDLYSTTDHVGAWPTFSLTDKSGITIRGTPLLQSGKQVPGTVLMLHLFDPSANPDNPNPDDGAYPRPGLFSCNNVNGLTVEWLSIRMTREPYSTGIVAAKGITPDNLAWVELRMTRDYSDLTDNLQLEEILDYDPVTLRSKGLDFAAFGIVPGQYTATVSHEGSLQKVRIQETSPASTLDYSLTHVPPNTSLVLLHSKFKCHFLSVNGDLDALGARRSRDLVVRNTTIRDIPGLGLYALNTHNITLDKFDILPKADRVFSSAAGGALLGDTTGTLVMRNCHMKRIGDDGLDSFTRYVTVNDIVGVPPTFTDADVRLNIPANYGTQMRWTGGQLVEFFSPTMIRRAAAPVQMTSFSPITGARFPISSLPTSLMVDDVAWNQSVSPDSITMEDCVVEDSFASGLRVHGSNVDIRGCTFHRTSNTAILMEADLKYFQEAGPCHPRGASPEMISVTDCAIDGCNSYGLYGAITIIGRRVTTPTIPSCSDLGSDAQVCDAGLHQHVLIANNSFLNLNNETGNARAAIWVEASDDVQINSNRFQDILYDTCRDDQNILHGENNTNLSSDGFNCVNGFFNCVNGVPGTLLTLLCSPLQQHSHPLPPICDRDW